MAIASSASASSEGVRDNSNKTFLDEEAAELDALVTNLEKTNTVTILNSFDTRLAHLESSVLPIHKSTQSLTRLAGNMNQTVAALESILSYFDLAAREETIIMRPLTEQDLQIYLQSIGRIREALKAMNSVNLKAGERAVQQLRRSLKVAVGKLHELFKQILVKHSVPLDLRVVTSSDRKDIPHMSQHPTQTLVQLAKSLAETELDPNVTPTGYLKSYCEIRANTMIKSLEPLYRSSMVELKGVYDKGSSPFIQYTASLLKLCRNEADVADTLLDAKMLSLAFMGSIMPPIEQWVEAGRSIVKRVKKSYMSEVGILFDIVESLETSMGTFESVYGLARRQKENDAFELLKSFKAGAMRTFIDFLNELRNQNNVKYQAMPPDGSVHQLTSDVTDQKKKEKKCNPESGSGPSAQNRRSQAAGRGGRNAIVQHYI
ncbi:exocyst complex component exo70, partial [Lunasporangiospora selenospora]